MMVVTVMTVAAEAAEAPPTALEEAILKGLSVRLRLLARVYILTETSEKNAHHMVVPQSPSPRSPHDPQRRYRSQSHSWHPPTHRRCRRHPRRPAETKTWRESSSASQATGP
jgi:hypothetical protein